MKYTAIILSAVLTVALCCPPEEALYPCVCKKHQGSSYTVDIICDGLHNEIDLKNAAAACKNRHDVLSFVILNSVLNYIPQSAFEGTFIRAIEVQESTLFSLSDTEQALVGMEKTLESLTLIRNIFMGSWHWSKLKSLTKLIYLKVREIALPSIEKDIDSLNFLRNIDFSKNEISLISDKAFENFKNLEFLVLGENEIKEVKRNMLPNPASQLRVMNFTQNRIQALPTDMFDNMPKLTAFHIKHNRLLTLDEKVFASVWSQLFYIDISDNDLRCDCRMSWMMQRKFPLLTLGLCSEPPELRGKNITMLSLKDLWC
ncbi:Slit-like protein, partial [Stegodyphus mimosarum]